MNWKFICIKSITQTPLIKHLLSLCSSMRTPTRPCWHLIMRRKIQNRFLLSRHSMRHDIHDRILPPTVRCAIENQIHAKRHVGHRCRCNYALLHWTLYAGQWRRVGRFCDASSFPRFSYLQVLTSLAGSTNSRLYAQIVRVWARLSRVFARDGHHYLCNCDVLRREECRRHQLYVNSGRILVHHCDNDDARLRWHGAGNDCGQNCRRCLLAVWCACHCPARARHCVQL